MTQYVSFVPFNLLINVLDLDAQPSISSFTSVDKQRSFYLPSLWFTLMLLVIRKLGKPMNKLRNSQSGFSALEVILIVVVIGILGAVGWYVMKQKNNNDSTANSSNPNTSQNSNNNSKEKSLDISDWGVKFSYTGVVQLTSYHVQQDFTYVNISSNELTTADSSCSAENGGIGGIARAKTDKAMQVPGPDFALTGAEYLQKHPDSAVQKGDYVYAYYLEDFSAPHGSMCKSPDSSQAVQTSNALKAAF